MSGAENGAKRAKESDERRGAVSGSRKNERSVEREVEERERRLRSGGAEITEIGFDAERQNSPLRSALMLQIGGSNANYCHVKNTTF